MVLDEFTIVSNLDSFSFVKDWNLIGSTVILSDFDIIEEIEHSLQRYELNSILWLFFGTY